MRPFHTCISRILLSASLVLPLSGLAQVSQIKSASGRNSSAGRGGSGADAGQGGGSSMFALWAVTQTARGVANWQAATLRRRPDIPSLVSLEVMPQFALRPPANYWLLPRIRGNWGLFSTDFRYNFLIEDNALAGKTESLGTFDWQVLQLNFVNTRPVTVRAGAGFMTENFGNRNSFFEGTIGADLRLGEGKYGGGIEYRLAKDYSTGQTPRRELNARAERRVAAWNRIRAYATLGAVFQRYYGQTDVWGVQTGLVFRLQ